MTKYTCRDKCGAEFETAPDDANGPPGWRYLEICKGWRCSTCDQVLWDASTMQGQGVETPDLLDPTSRGAIPKSTAHTIMPPSDIH